MAHAGLDRAGDQNLARSAASAGPWPGTADERLVGLDGAVQQRTAGCDHGPADLVQPGPRGLVAAETELPLQFEGRDAAFAAGEQVYR